MMRSWLLSVESPCAVPALTRYGAAPPRNPLGGLFSLQLLSRPLGGHSSYNTLITIRRGDPQAGHGGSSREGRSSPVSASSCRIWKIGSSPQTEQWPSAARIAE